MCDFFHLRWLYIKWNFIFLWYRFYSFTYILLRIHSSVYTFFCVSNSDLECVISFVLLFFACRPLTNISRDSIDIDCNRACVIKLDLICFSGSPADGQLSANDQLFTINGQIAYNLPQPQVISMIRYVFRYLCFYDCS